MAETQKTKVMVVACADSPLLQERARIPMAGDCETLWFSESALRPEADCPVVHAPIYPWLGSLTRIATAVRFLLSYWSFRPDVLHVHWAVFPPLLLDLSWWRNVVVSPMGSDIFLPGLFAFRKRISRRVLSRAAVVTSKSAFMDQQLISLGVAAERIVRVTWGVADAFFSAKEHQVELRRQMTIDPETLVFFSPRAMKPLYRIDAIVRAFSDFKKNGGSGLLLVSEMAGTVDERESLLSLLDSDVDRKDVRFLGQLNAAEMRAAYAVADAVVSYARSDGMPQTLYETMAAGCYPIFTDLPQYHCLISGVEDGFLCKAEDEKTLVSAMNYVMTEVKGQWNPEPNRDRIRSLASRTVETNKMLDIYHRLHQTGSFQS